ncbi:MAG: transglutaminase-like domain-containing protein, partial [Armatimonadota bacterium]|nr:transglutaminase-like domain-containing protein [Armatimonadota bacterium]
EAMAGLGEDEAPSSPAGDFAVLTSMKADVDLPLPRRIKSLKLRVTGIPDQKLAVSDVRQKATWIKTSDKPTVDYAIIAVKPDGKKSAKLPLRAVSLKPFLAEAPYIQCNHPDIKKQARLIVGKETNAFKAANKIRAWVQANMRAQADIGIVRSSLDVLNNRVGVCRDYAILYAALARAAGIPTRIVTGLVFTNGSFYYHVWAESYTGVWTPFDATLNTDFVDATHIKMAQGDATSMFEVSKAIGGLKAHIIDYKHLEK